MYNKESGYGRAVMQALLNQGGGNALGRVFLVGAATLTNLAYAQQIFKHDPSGVQRIFTTMALALAQCTAAQGDVICVLPGHTETYSSATAALWNISGVTIVGLGTGSLRPTFTLDTATTTTIAVSAPNITVKNCLFIGNFAAIVALFTLTTAQEFALLGCEFRDTSAILNFVNIVSTDATSQDAAGLRIEDCRRIGAGADTNTTIVNMLGTNDRVYIKRNYFAHAAVTAAGLMIIATGKVVTNAEILDNVINLVGATGTTTGIIITTNGSTNSGIIGRNFIQSLDATTEILVTASSGFIFSQNWYSAVADKSGYLLPAADA